MNNLEPNNIGHSRIYQEWERIRRIEETLFAVMFSFAVILAIIIIYGI